MTSTTSHDSDSSLVHLEQWRARDKAKRAAAMAAIPIAECDNTSCTNKVRIDEPNNLEPFGPIPGIACSGCSAVYYCKHLCQVAGWSAHKAVCTVPQVVAMGGIHLSKGVSDEPSLHGKYFDIKYNHPETGAAVKVGHLEVQVLQFRRYGFFEYLDEHSHELANLALQFDSTGRLRQNNGCWQREDFENQRHLVYLKELVIDLPWRGKGIGRCIFPMLFQLRELKGAKFVFTLPNVLDYLEPDSVNGFLGTPTPAEQAALLEKREGIIKFYRKAAFRRLANSVFFCLAMDSSHPSHHIPIDEDASFEELPPPHTEEEVSRRTMAYN